MNEYDLQTETRPVSGFDRVSIRGNICSAQIFITQADRESLTIEAPPEYLGRLSSEVKAGKLNVRLEGSWWQELEDALTTCVNRPPLIFRLEVCQLTSLVVQCAYRVHIPRLETPHLQLRLNGVGDVQLDWLAAETLEVQHAGTGTIRISGRVAEQSVVLNGVGSYLAPALDSQRARVRLSGTGLARVHASQSLEATLRGVGVLEYSGQPRVSQRVSGPGRIVPVAEARRAPA